MKPAANRDFPTSLTVWRRSTLASSLPHIKSSFVCLEKEKERKPKETIHAKGHRKTNAVLFSSVARLDQDYFARVEHRRLGPQVELRKVQVLEQ